MPIASFLSKPKLTLLHCATGKKACLDSFPAWIGGKGANLEVDESDQALVEFSKNDGSNGPQLKVISKTTVYVNGVQRTSHGPMNFDEDLAILVDSHLILATWTKNHKKWLGERGLDSWRIVTPHSEVLAGPMELERLGKAANSIYRANPEAILHQTHCKSGFFLKDVAGALQWSLKEVSTEPATSDHPVVAKGVVQASGPAEPEDIAEINSDSGEFTCPVCWIRFDRGDLLHVATHESLKGDPVLGEEHMLRFTATRFNNSGQALDAMGIPATEMACPHCRRALPPSFIDLKQHIFSLVGAPSSGKSYYLSVLVKTLQNSLFTVFKSAFYDADPKENIRLTEMKNKLFSAARADEASIAKTDLEGDMYIPITRMGRKVSMPRPFIFNVAAQDGKSDPMAIVFYDNAGEHFEPTSDSVSSPGAQHVAAASGILFLFDPTYNLEFRRRLDPEIDPQLRDQRFDQQDTLLAEMNARVKKLRNLDFRKPIETPLAVLVGKMDVWQGLLPPEHFTNPLAQFSLNMKSVEENSAKMRALLLEIVPSIVANAETISSKVLYFPISTFGCSPEEISPDPKSGRRRFSPDPLKLNPQMVDIPMLWLLSQIEPKLIRIKR